MPEARIRLVVLVYVAAFLQGVALVSFPASGAVFKEVLGFDDARYGAIFLPQVAMAIAGSLAGASFASRLGLRTLLVVSLLSLAVSQACLAASVIVPPQTAFAIVLLGTASLGFGFGIGGAPLNSYPPLFYPGRAASAVVALHTLLGLGLSAGPLAVGALFAAQRWIVFPSALAAACVALAAAVALSPLPRDTGQATSGSTGTVRPYRAPAFWAFVLIAVLYAFAEGTFSNWIVIYLGESKRLAHATGAAALSLFWAMLVAGRLIVSALVARIAPQRIWMVLPLGMIGCFLGLPYADSDGAALALFGAAGLACSAFFPLTIALASQRFPQYVAWVSSMLIAALMAGVGLGSFVTGALRMMIPFERLYPAAALYPLAALLVIALLAASASRAAMRTAWPRA
jgi:fucose permease